MILEIKYSCKDEDLVNQITNYFPFRLSKIQNMLMESFIILIKILILKSKFKKLCNIDFNIKIFMFKKVKLI